MEQDSDSGPPVPAEPRKDRDRWATTPELADFPERFVGLPFRVVRVGGHCSGARPFTGEFVAGIPGGGRFLGESHDILGFWGFGEEFIGNKTRKLEPMVTTWLYNQPNSVPTPNFPKHYSRGLT